MFILTTFCFLLLGVKFYTMSKLFIQKNILKSSLILILIIALLSLNVYAALEHIEGLEYGVRVIEDLPLEKNITKNYDLYELYFQNKTDKIFSIPGYSIDLGVDYSNFAEINSQYKDAPSKKLAILNIATGAASIALGGIARTAANAVKSVGNLRKKNLNLAGEDAFLSPYKTYIVYPGDAISVLFLVNKYLQQSPNTVRFVCHDEELNVNNIVINNKFKLDEGNIKNAKNLNSNSDSSKPGENVIAAPTSEYK